ncbi:hypothetical protein B0T10DRAFT_470770 [Thelonectria olida]|uniref:Uncharacterized protein n=1 Tax=Thelonectria olida TaxID=1576542 RepID=A0A9P8WMG8_9HYPO|nr:hypothetical protein B0T10DRAFT_470770 [Thelonectria olida]
MSAQTPVISTKVRITAFGLWAGLLGSLAIIDFSAVTKPLLWSITLALITLTLEAFLLFKVAYYTPFTSYRTTKWHEFFYQSRHGSMTLLVLCALWLLALLAILSMVLLDLVLSGPISAALGRLYNRGGVLMVLADGIYVFTVFDFLFLMAWVFWTGAKAFWRVTAPVNRRDEYEAGLGLMLGQQSD